MLCFVLLFAVCGCLPTTAPASQAAAAPSSAPGAPSGIPTDAPSEPSNAPSDATPNTPSGKQILLPQAKTTSSVSLEEALAARRTVRVFSNEALTLEQTAQLLWAAQGVSPDAVSSATATGASAGAIYPIKITVVAGNIEGLAAGVYRYDAAQHALLQVSAGDVRKGLSDACLRQTWMSSAASCLVLSADDTAMAARYRALAPRFVHIEAGAVAQNIALQSAALDLGSTPVGTFEEMAVAALLSLDEAPLLIVTVGTLP